MRDFYSYCGLLLFLAGTLLLQSGCGGDARSNAPEEAEESAPVPVETAVVEVGPASAFFSGTATLEADEEALVVAKIGGVVEKLFVEEGSYVRAGEPLAQLDVERLTLELARAEASLRKLERAHERNEELFAQQLISAEEYEQIKSEYETATANRDLVQLEHEYATVRAPIGGVVSERLVKVGNMLRANDAAFRITDFDPLLAVMHVPERELGKIRVGQPVDLHFDALPGQQFTGRVERISPIVDPATGTFRVTVAVRDAEQRLKPGLFGRLRILYDTRGEALLVPKEAVLEEDNATSLFVVRDGRAFRQVVETGYQNGTRIEIINGAQQNDTVIVTGQSSLKDSTRVEAVN